MMWEFTSELSWSPGEQGSHETSRTEAKRNMSFECCGALEPGPRGKHFQSVSAVRGNRAVFSRGKMSPSDV